MLSTLAWRSLREPDIADDIDTLREETVRLFFWMTLVGYLVWHSISAYQASWDDFPRYWVLFPFVALTLAATYVLLHLKSRLAIPCFLSGAILSITAATWILKTPFPTVFLPVCVLIAVVLLHPLAGFVVCTGSLGLLFGLWQAGPFAFLGVERLIETGIVSLVATITAWVLGRNMVTAVEWSIDSYRQALRNMQAAQSHRAELVQALKQLDSAYYRLERANVALELAWKAAEAAEQSKTEFVNNISHELRTPLNLIVGFSEIIVTSPESYGVPLPAAYRGDVNAIYRSAQHVLTLTNDVLDLARVGAGRMALAREPADLRQIIKEACDIVREYVTTKRLWLQVEIRQDLPAVMIDRLRIRQVLLNLLTNAARFTERGGITVSVELTDGQIVVKVSDTGRGIASEDLSRVFQEFRTAGPEGSLDWERFGGTGLGLPISKRFVELHGGLMGVESAMGVGTTFWFTLPMANVEKESHEEVGRGFARNRLLTTGERALVLVGGDAQLGQLFQRHLRGYQVITAEDVAGAVSTAKDCRATAILADLDTVERTNWKDFPLPVLRLPLPHGERVASALGVAAYLVKPVTRQRLRAAIRRLGRPVRSVLIVDDDPRFTRLVTRMLRADSRHSVTSILITGSGREALELMTSTRPDLVLLDLMIPEVTGEEVLAAMAATSSLADVPVIVISGQERGPWRIPLHGSISIDRADGFCLEELLEVVEALLSALRPPRPYPASRQ